MLHAIIPRREFQTKTCNCCWLQFFDGSNSFDMRVRTIIAKVKNEWEKKKGRRRRRTVNIRNHLSWTHRFLVNNVQRQISVPYSKAENCSAKDRWVTLRLIFSSTLNPALWLISVLISRMHTKTRTPGFLGKWHLLPKNLSRRLPADQKAWGSGYEIV